MQLAQLSLAFDVSARQRVHDHWCIFIERLQVASPIVVTSGCMRTDIDQGTTRKK